MLSQLAKATSDWDDSVFVDDKFKSLIDGTSKHESLPPHILESPHLTGATAHEMTRYFSNLNLSCDSDDQGEGLEDDLSRSVSPLYIDNPCILRDRTRDLLFSIPEEEAISFSDVIIETY